MSQENVETVETAFRAWNRGDRDGWLAPAHPEVEWSSATQRQVEGAETVYRGQVSEMRDLDDSVLALAQIRATGKASGVEVQRSIGYVFEFEDGLLRKGRAFLSPEEALEAAGLSE
jgi:hypothetical protein